VRLLAGIGVPLELAPARELAGQSFSARIRRKNPVAAIGSTVSSAAVSLPAAIRRKKT